MRILKVVYIKETQKTCDFVKRIVTKIKCFFNIINVENKSDKIIYNLPIFYNENKSKNKLEKLSKRIIKSLEEDGLNNVFLSKYLSDSNELKNCLYSKNINILNGRYLFKCLIKETIIYILKIRNEDIKRTEISMLVNDFNEFNQNLVIDIAKEVKALNIITNHINKWKKVEENLYNEYGILINISNNKKSSLACSKIIFNLDFPSEIINQYKIYDMAIIVNILEKVQIKSKKFSGINVNYFEIKMPKKYKLDCFKNELVYESMIYKKELYKARKIILNDKIKIKKLIGNNGIIKENEFNTKHLTKF